MDDNALRQLKETIDRATKVRGRITMLKQLIDQLGDPQWEFVVRKAPFEMKISEISDAAMTDVRAILKKHAEADLLAAQDEYSRI